MSIRRTFLTSVTVITLLGLIGQNTRTFACPFCTQSAQTLSEEIGSMDAVVIARLVKAPPPPDPDKGLIVPSSPAEVPKATFRIETVLRGTVKQKEIQTLYFGDGRKGQAFLIMGVDPPDLMWSTPMILTDRGQQYVKRLVGLSEDSTERLKFFQNYLEDDDEMLARDAYDEFAKAPYEAVIALKPAMNHDQLVAWIQDADVPASRRRLYLTMLGVCGRPTDVPMLEEMLKSDDRKSKAGLDALIACYLTLKKADGMPLVEELFLKDEKAEYADTYAAIMALRFHGTETDLIPRERLLEGLRYMLSRPALADLVIPDLARWEDWRQIDRLVTLFKEADEKSSWVRVPVINYLRACPLPEAKERIAELEKIDPAAVKRANTFFPFGAGDTAAGSGSDDKKDAEAKQETGDPQEAAKADSNPPKAKSTKQTSTPLRLTRPAKVASVKMTPPAPEPAVTNRLPFVAVPLAVGSVLMFTMWTLLSGTIGRP